MKASVESDIDSDEELDEDQDSGSDFEDELKPQKRRAKSTAHGTPPPKRLVRTAKATASRSPCSTVITPVREQGPVSTTAAHLYDAVRSGKTALATMVDEWLDSYKQDKETGLLELINFLVLCCGCKAVVTREMFDTLQNAEIIGRLTKDFNEASTSYPLIAQGTQGRRFRTGLSEFLQHLVLHSRNSLLYDEYLFSSILALLTGLSDSQVRAFRHTSTFIAMKLMTSLVGVAVEVSAQTEVMQRRYELEKNKEAEDRALERLEELHQNFIQLKEQQEELKSMMNSAFKGVFVHRYRDRVPEIRAVCMEELGAWLKGNPETFLSDGYLKYLGWTLHDKQGAVRLQCVRALQALFREKVFAGRLELFINRFKERMLCMVLDKDSEVAVEAIHLLLLIHQQTEEGLSEEECGHVYSLVFASHRGMASAAGAFLYHRLCTEMGRELQETADRRKAFVHLLISFFIQAEFHEHAAYLVDSLWDCAGAELKDWETMTSLLLQEKGQGQVLDDREESALIELMMSVVRQAAESCPPVGRAPGKRILSMKDKKMQAQDKRRLTNHFMLVLPQLLAKYSADVEKVTSLLKAPLYFNLETYSTGRLEKYLDLLIAQVCDIVEKHHNDGVLDACARVACTLCKDSYSFSARAELAVSQLIDNLMDRFTSQLNDLLEDTADEDELYSAATTLKRIAAFSSAKDLTGRQLFEPCIKILRCGVESRELSSELMVPAMKCAVFHVMWEKVKFHSSEISKVALNQLKRRLESLYSMCQSCLSAGEASLRDQAFVLLCDLLLVFSSGSARGDPHLQTLTMPPSVTLRAEMASFLLDYIFTETQYDMEEEDMDKITMLQKCRNQLAGYCKLVVYGVLELSAASDIFKHYNKFFRDYGDIIKETLSNSKIISPTESARTVCLCLQQMYSDLPFEHGVEWIRNSEEFREIRELAHRLAMTFGIDLHRVRMPLLSLHEDGILFSLRSTKERDEPPLNLLFLEILSEFSFKLLRQDRSSLLALMKRAAPSPLPAWPSLQMYQRSLNPMTRGSEKTRSTSQSLQGDPAPKRRRTATDSVRSRSSVLQGLESSSVVSEPSTPALTSTVLRSTHRRSKPQTRTEKEDELQHSLAERHEPVSPTRMNLRSRSKQPLASNTASTHSDLGSQLNLLTLIEENEEEEDVPEEDELSDISFTLPSTRHSASFLEELFD